MAIFKMTEENISAINKGFAEGLEKGFDSCINQVCYECGVTANILTCLKKYKAPPKQLVFIASTYSEGKCDLCEENKFITSTRDFYYPDFSLLQKNWILKLKK